MQMDFKLDIVQKQKLILTQTMQQSINVLQMSAYELREYIDKQFEENPVLEDELDLVESRERFEYKDIIKKIEDNNYSENYSNQYNNEEEVSVFNFIADNKSLKDYLYEQLYELRCEKKIKKIIEYMIESLNSNGYLENTIENICEELKSNTEIVKYALDILQGLEPVGIGARNLKECLLIQLRSRGVSDKYLEEIIVKYLEYIADSKYEYISKQLKITAKEVQAYSDIIRSLEPKPSRGYYTGEEVKFIIPDAYIVKFNSGHKVIMNNSIVPNITINNLYKSTILNKKDNKEIDYINDKISKAINLINDIEQRNTTVLKVLECIVDKQKEYFEKGVIYLKPMTLKDISDDVGLHESTISRAIKDKYILTSRGTVKVKDLFCNGMASSIIGCQDISVKLIKNKIKEMVDLENKKKPLADQAICDLLNKDQINISRRTVAKYREELGIKSSSKRKRI